MPTPRWSRAAVWLAAALGCYLGAVAADRSRVVVRGDSMLPRLWPGDVLLTVPAWGRRRPGQVVVARDPADRDHLVIKRVTGVDGRRVFLRGDHPERSTDSRTWGWLDRRAVRRRALRRWPDLRTPLTVPPSLPDVAR